MGTGSLNNETGEFNFVVVADHPWNDGEKDAWKARFIEASRALHEATEGQLRFGQIFMADEAWGLGHAEFVLHDFPATAYATYGGYGQLGQSIQLFADQLTGNPLTIVHEFGHHAFELGDEYSGPVVEDAIDADFPIPAYDNYDPEEDPEPPRYNVVPLLPSELDSQSLQYGYAILKFGGVIRRMIVSDSTNPPTYLGHTPTQLTVAGDFGQDPRTANGERVFYQPQYNYSYPEYPDGIVIRCPGLGIDSANYCLMDHYEAEPGDEAVTEFCSQGNHDPDEDTSHSDRHGGLSCWEVIQQVMQDKYSFSLAAPNPAAPGQQTDDSPYFFDLEKEARIALVMDRSGSMGTDNKIQGARHGVEMWIDNAHQDDDWLSVIWFNDEPDLRLALAQIDADQIDTIKEEVNDVDPGGWTNIRDSLYEAVEQIQSANGRAAVQAIVLLTDGVHNRPFDTEISEAIPTLQDAGIPVYAIALGTPENVDYDALEELTRETGGMILQVGLLEDNEGSPLTPDEQLAYIAIHIFLVNDWLRNGFIQVAGQIVGGAPPESTFGKAITEVRGRRLGLKKLAKLQDLDGIHGFVKKHEHPHVFTVPFLVEEGASKARVAITHASDQEFHLYLIDPEGKPVDFTASSGATLVAPESPYEIAMAKEPKPGLWHAVVVRAATGAATHVNCSVGVENRMIVVHADCDRVVDLDMPVGISAGAVWGDRLSGLRVTAQLTGPNGSTHTVVLTDETSAEPNSGDYRGVFVPEEYGRYRGTVRIMSRGKAQYAGGMHRVTHAPQEGRKPVELDLHSKAPAFVRRIPIYFDVGKRPKVKDLDGRRREHGKRAPVRPREKKLTPLNIDKALELVKQSRREKGD